MNGFLKMIPTINIPRSYQTKEEVYLPVHGSVESCGSTENACRSKSYSGIGRKGLPSTPDAVLQAGEALSPRVGTGPRARLVHVGRQLYRIRLKDSGMKARRYVLDAHPFAPIPTFCNPELCGRIWYYVLKQGSALWSTAWPPGSKLLDPRLPMDREMPSESRTALDASATALLKFSGSSRDLLNPLTQSVSGDHSGWFSTYSVVRIQSAFFPLTRDV